MEREQCDEDPYGWLCSQRGCFVVQFVLAGKVDQKVCVDGRRRMIWDIEEDFPLQLNPDALRLCTGMNSKATRVMVMEVVQQHEKSGAS